MTGQVDKASILGTNVVGGIGEWSNVILASLDKASGLSKEDLEGKAKGSVVKVERDHKYLTMLKVTRDPMVNMADRVLGGCLWVIGSSARGGSRCVGGSSGSHRDIIRKEV